MSADLTPAERLTGRVLANGWVVGPRLAQAPDATGGHFSTSYRVQRGAQSAFLKAIDIQAALRGDPSRFMEIMERVAGSYNHEKALLEACASRNLDRVVRTIDAGQEYFDVSNPASLVFYLVFDLAEGDVRSTLGSGRRIYVGRALRTLHDIAVGIRQLHGIEIAHQDLKPSNVLLFAEDREVSRIADLGRASTRGTTMPHDLFPGAGDRGYWTPEALYTGSPPTWAGRRSCDLYQLGSMLLFLFSGATATASWSALLPAAYRPAAIGGPYRGSFEDALPALRDAMQTTCEHFPDVGDVNLRSKLVRIFRELCEPDPSLRGHPRDRAQDQYSVNRFVADFDLEARRFDGRMFVRDV